MDVFELVARIGLDTSEYERGLNGAANKGKGFGEKLASVGKAAAKGFAVVTGAATAVVAGLVGVEQATEEYRVAMGKLNTAFDSAGLGADAAKKTYTDFYKILGDTDTATEASQLLAKLALSEQDLSKWTNISAGVMGTFGDSLPIEGLIESANETAKVGQITGSLADALNWAGISEDAFNEKLAACSDESERNRLIMDTLSGTYSAAADSFYQNNEAIIQNRENSARLQETMAKVGEAVTVVKNALIAEFLPAIESVGGKLADFLTSVNIEAFADGATGAFSAVKDGFLALVEQAQTDGTWLNEIWTGLQGTAQAFGNFLVALWDIISTAFAWCVVQINTEGTYLQTIWQNIQTFISAAVTVIQNVIKLFTAILTGDWSAAWNAVQTITQTVSSAITTIISNIVTWVTGFLGTMVSTGFELINSMATGIQNKFAEIFTAVGGWVTDNIITPIEDMGTDLYNAGVNLLNNFWDGLESVWDSIVSWWDGLFLSDKSANVNVNHNSGGYATGLNYVPYDEFPALLHRGEAVLTAAEARVWRNGGYAGTPAMAGGVVINQYIQSVPQSPVDLANTTEAYFEQARWML